MIPFIDKSSVIKLPQSSTIFPYQSMRDTMTQNVDDEEIKKFAEHAATWWDETGEMRALHDLNPLRMNYIQSKTNLVAKKVADIGCGGGILSESLAASGADVTGIDMNDKAIQVAKLHLLESQQKVTYLTTTAEEHAEQHAGQYDVVTCLEMLEHVPDPASVTRACAKLLKPGGHLFFSTLNRNPKSYLFAIIGAEYVLRLLPRNTHDYAKFIKPSELDHWTTNAGLTTKEIKGVSYNPLTKNFRMTDDPSVNYLFYCVREV